MTQDPALLMNYRKQNAYLVESIRRYPDRLVGMMVIDPWYQVGVFDVLEGLVEQGVRAIKLHPKVHNFRPDDDIKIIEPIMEKAVKMNLPVHFHTGDPFCEPGRIEFVADRFPDAMIIMCHMATQMISYAPDAVGVCKRRERVYLETGFHERRMREAVRALGPEKLLFASDCPINDIWTGLTMVKSLELNPPVGIGLREDDTLKILGGNAKKLIGL